MQDLQEIRHYLHQHPELSKNESATSKYIIEQFKSIGISDVKSVGNPKSILAKIAGQGKGKTILFRCELDALPIHEQNEFEYRSKVDGVSHKCGHDGHMTIMLGLAYKLVQQQLSGDVYLLFQSAEEIGHGAQAVLDSGELNDKSIDYVFALHNVPGYDKCSVVIKESVFTPTVESFWAEFTGETSHAGEPDKGKNPSACIASVIQQFNKMHQPDSKKEEYFVVAPVFIKMGEESYGISAGKGSLGYTFRSYDQTFFNQQKKKIEEIVSELAKERELSIRFKWKEAFRSTINDSDAISFIKTAAKSLQLNIIDKTSPFDWGEDFGLFTQHYKGALFGWGAGKDCYPLHDSRYDFPDDIITDAIDLFYEIAKQIQE
jgi:amidohydrolase